MRAVRARLEPMPVLKRLPPSWPSTAARMMVAIGIAIFIGWVMDGGLLGALLGIPVGVIVGFVAELNLRRWERRD